MMKKISNNLSKIYLMYLIIQGGIMKLIIKVSMILSLIRSLKVIVILGTPTLIKHT